MPLSVSGSSVGSFTTMPIRAGVAGTTVTMDAVLATKDVKRWCFIFEILIYGRWPEPVSPLVWRGVAAVPRALHTGCAFRRMKLLKFMF